MSRRTRSIAFFVKHCIASLAFVHVNILYPRFFRSSFRLSHIRGSSSTIKIFGRNTMTDHPKKSFYSMNRQFYFE
jgi:hypothetical protein